MTKHKINLLAIAKQSEKDYQEVELNLNGEIVTELVYKVPSPVIWTYMPARPEPQSPTRLMRPDMAGNRQRILIKEGDEGWIEYQADLADYENEVDNIQNAARYVLALADIEYPDLSEPPPLAKKNRIVYPANEMLRKKVWLDYTIFLEHSNLMAVQAAMLKSAKANTITNDQVNDVKKSSESKSGENNK